MVQQGFLETEVPSEAEWWWHQPVSVLPLKTPITVQEDTTCSKAIEILEKEQIDQMPIVSKTGWVGSVIYFCCYLAAKGLCTDHC